MFEPIAGLALVLLFVPEREIIWHPSTDALPAPRWTVDKLEQMLGSYAPSPDGSPYTKKFPEEESPSGMLARSGTYHVKSRVVDDDDNVYRGAS